MRSIVGLSDQGELFRALQALSSGKVRLLVKESQNSASATSSAAAPASNSSTASASKSSEVGEGDVFYLDAKFKHKLFRVKLSALQLKADPAAQAAVLESVDRDRACVNDSFLLLVPFLFYPVFSISFSNSCCDSILFLFFVILRYSLSESHSFCFACRASCFCLIVFTSTVTPSTRALCAR